MKIFAIGMNYTEHNKSLHGTLSKPERPVIFTKADSALLNNGKPFFIPDHLGRIEYETEVVVRISKLGKTIPQRFAHRYYDAVTVGIDFTAREMQKKLREAGQPWELAKGFDGSAVIGEWVDIQKFRDIQALHFRLDLNDKTVQEGCTSDMLYKVNYLLHQPVLHAQDGRPALYRMSYRLRSCQHRRPSRRLSRRQEGARFSL